MKTKIPICIILSILAMLPLIVVGVDAENSYIYKSGEIADIAISCFDENNYYCNANTNCNITIGYPNGTILINNLLMTRNPSSYNYTLNKELTEIIGTYSAVVMCNGTTNGYSTFNFEINNLGYKNIMDKWSIPVSIGFALLIIITMTISMLAGNIALRWMFIFLTALFSISFFAVLIQFSSGSYATRILNSVFGILIILLTLIIAVFFIWFLIQGIKAILGYENNEINKIEEEYYG